MPLPTVHELLEMLGTFDWASYNAELKGELEAIGGNIVNAQGRRAAEELGSQFKNDDPFLQRHFTQHVGDAITSIDGTTRDNVIALIRTIVSSEEGIGSAVELGDRITEKVRETFEGYADWRADTIARTETADLYNLGNLAGFRQAGVDKVRVSDGDDDAECRAADGQIWDLAFALANRLAHPNCERDFSPVLDEDAVADTMATPEPVTEPELTEVSDLTLITEGEVTTRHPLPGSPNEVEIIELADSAGNQVKTIFKSVSGENYGDEDDPVRHTVDALGGASYALREELAFLIDRALGTDLVPETVVRTIKGEEGMVQAFVDGARTYYEAQERGGSARIGDEDTAKLAVLDIVIGNTDRHGGNLLLTANGRIVAIDHGLAFPKGLFDDEFGWEEFRQEIVAPGWLPVSPVLKERLISGLDEIEFRMKFPQLSDGEREALWKRADAVREALKNDTLGNLLQQFRNEGFNR